MSVWGDGFAGCLAASGVLLDGLECEGGGER